MSLRSQSIHRSVGAGGTSGPSRKPKAGNTTACRLETLEGRMLLTAAVPELLVATSSGLIDIAPSGEQQTVVPSISNYAGVERVGDEFYVHTGGAIVGYDADGGQRSTTPVPAGIFFLRMAALADGRFALMNNDLDEVYFIDRSGTLLNTAKILPAADDSLQNVDAVQVGNDLILSEDGSNHVMKIDLTTYAVSQFKDLSSLGGWIGAITYDSASGAYYICQSERLVTFTEQSAPTEVGQLPEGSITGIMLDGGYAYLTVNSPGKVYRVDLASGSNEVVASGLNYPQDVVLAPQETITIDVAPVTISEGAGADAATGTITLGPDDRDGAGREPEQQRSHRGDGAADRNDSRWRELGHVQPQRNQRRPAGRPQERHADRFRQRLRHRHVDRARVGR